MRFEILPPPKTTLNTFALSPDGRKLIIQRARRGRTQQFVDPPDGFAPARELPGTEGAGLDPEWSPDSQYVAFLRRKAVSRRSTLRRASADLGPGSSNPATGISWSRQDVILYGSKGVINRVAASGGRDIPVTVLNSQRG
jgi:Tol biopolymer transport system component